MSTLTSRSAHLSPSASSAPGDGAVLTRVGRWTPWLLFALALALRLYRLGDESLWVDEGNSLRDAAGLTAHGRYRPLYYLVLAAWQHLGTGEAWLRVPSVLFGAGAVALLFLAARRLAGARIATVAALLMTFAIPELDHSQEVRMYAMGSFLGLASVVALLRWLDRRRAIWVAVHGVLAAMAALTSAGSLLLVVPAAGAAAWLHRRDRRIRAGLLAAWLMVAAVLASQAGHARRGLGEFGGERRWITPPVAGELFYFAGRRLVPNMQYLGEDPAQVAVLKVTAIVALALLALAVANPHRDPRLVAARPIALVLAAVVAAVWIYSQLTLPLWMARTFHSVAPAVYVLVAMGLVALRELRPRLGIAAVTLLAAVLAGGATKYYLLPERDDWRGALAWVDDHARPGATVCVVDPIYFPIVRYYRPATTCGLDTDLSLGEEATTRHAADLLAQMAPGRGASFVVMRVAKRFSTLHERMEEELARQGRLLGTFVGLNVRAFAVAPEPRPTAAGLVKSPG